MANRDYVKRGKGSTRTSRKKAPSRKKPWRSGLLAIIATGVFAWGLYTLSSDPEPEIPAKSTPAVATQTEQKAKPKAQIPPPPEEKWDYVDTLPNREIEVQAKEQIKSKVPYIMQCGAYRTIAQAESRKLDIAFQGLSSQIVKKEGSSFHRVVLGPYSLKRDAERDKHKLQRAKIEPCKIWKEAL
ncbi:SPOR domain-containing protein [Vibrio hippocampi]|uniref:Cell division protein FtsN n=1 Tax=Vibrio hippocampi TaxID=654686 RepID=A0ABM8ZJW6_9VIBR|nr:SPOR domain-containing protein [Vibrio hippocampi]CAH0527225.1 Cell division protein FtsN [Vibrio hippocampi]